MLCSIHDFTFLMTDTKIKEHVSFEPSEKKETFAGAIFCKICYVACTILKAGKLICLCVCLHECNCAGLIDKPADRVTSVERNFTGQIKAPIFSEAVLAIEIM